MSIFDEVLKDANLTVWGIEKQDNTLLFFTALLLLILLLGGF